MIGLQPRLTEMNILDEKMQADGVLQRSFQTVETFRWLGLPVFRNQSLSVIRLTKPKDELELHVYGIPNIETIFKYSLRELNDKRTQITQTMQFVKVNKLFENFVVRLASQAQRALLSNLKVRLEKK
jgi:hypothetical protein